MPNDPEMIAIAQAVLGKCKAHPRDSAWDSSGTVAETLSQALPSAGTAKTSINQRESPTVPVSRTLGDGTVGQPENCGTVPGTVVGIHYGNVLTALRSDCPELIEDQRWKQAIVDADRFLATWEEQAHALGWSARELFGLHSVPAHRGPTYQRLSRYDETGLIWLLEGRPVIALAATEAAIQGSTGALVYRKHRKPALGPLGDSLDDMGACS